MERQESSYGDRIEDSIQLSSLSNLESLLETDESFLEFFNAFLSLSSFPEQLVYSKTSKRFEEFRKHLISNDDAERSNSRVLIPQNVEAENRCITKIKYLTKVLDQKQGFQWVQKYRMPLFLKSQFYVEYKLSRFLSVAQVNHIRKIIGDERNDVSNESIVHHSERNLNNSSSNLKQVKRSRKISCNIIYDSESDLTADYELPENEDSFDTKTWNEEKMKLNDSLCKKTSQITDNESIFDSDLDSVFLPNELEGSVSLFHDEQQSSPIPNSKTQNHSNVHFIHKKHPIKSIPKPQHQSRTISNIGNAMDSNEKLAMESISELIPSEDMKQDYSKLFEKLSNTFKDNSNNSTFDQLPTNSNWLSKLDLRTKEGIDTFKLFVFDSVTEKYLNLWLDIEHLKCLETDQLKFQLTEIKQTYFVCNARYEMPKDVKSIILNSGRAMANCEDLFCYQMSQLESILKYWCARFTLCICEKIRKHIPVSDPDVFQYGPGRLRARLLYQRPHTSAPACRQFGHEKDSYFHTNEQQETGKGKPRVKSAHPRLIITPNIKETNAGYQQLKLRSAPFVEKPGFIKKIPLTYKNNPCAYEDSYSENIRLLITPILPEDCKGICSERVNINALYNPKSVDSFDALQYERYSGGHFRKFIFKSKNKHWANCLDCWSHIKDYNDLFYAEKFSPTGLRRKAHAIFTNFILNTAKKDIGLPFALANQINKKLDPPYEDLFDAAEIHVTQTLKLAWEKLRSLEYNAYSEVEIENKIKYIQVERKMKMLPKSIFADSKEETPDGSDSESEEGLSDGKIPRRLLNAKVPIPEDGVTFDTLLQDKELLGKFEMFLEERNIKGLKDFNAWRDMEKFRLMNESDDVTLKHEISKAIKRKWLGKSYFFGDDSPASKAGQLQVLSLGGNNIKDENDLAASPPPSLILKAQQYTKARLQWLFLSMFKGTKDYQLIAKGRAKVGDVVEDVIMKRRLQKSENAWKVINNKASSDNKGIAELRSTLSDKNQRNIFKRFLALKGDCRENDVDFWTEIQAFKNLCHDHVDDFIFKRKIHTIVEVFIKSSVAPELRVNIPIEVSERLNDKVNGRVPNYGPYIFRESQAAVFQCLLSYWKEFQEFSENKESENIPSEIETLANKQSTDIRNKKLVLERRRLFKLANDRKRQEHDKYYKGKSTQDAMSVISETATVSSESQWEAKPFSYSKLLAPEYLQQVEFQMQRGGLTLENLEDQQKKRFRSRRRSGLPGFYREQSMISERSQTSQKTFLTETGRLSTTSGSEGFVDPILVENDQTPIKGGIVKEKLTQTKANNSKTDSRKHRLYPQQKRIQNSNKNRGYRKEERNNEDDVMLTATVIVS